MVIISQKCFDFFLKFFGKLVFFVTVTYNFPKKCKKILCKKVLQTFSRCSGWKITKTFTCIFYISISTKMKYLLEKYPYSTWNIGKKSFLQTKKRKVFDSIKILKSFSFRYFHIFY